MNDEGIAHVRTRPGMYIGGTGSSGVAHLVLEVLSNCFDLVLAGTATTLTVTADADVGSYSVTDDGPGIAVVVRVGPSFEELFTTVRSTPTADGHFPHLHLAIGCGLGPFCALCATVEATTHRPEGTYRQSFSRGVATSGLERTDPEPGARGTTIRFSPDPDIFEHEPAKVVDRLADELRQLAFLLPGLVTRLVVEGEEPIAFGPVADLRPAFDHAFAEARHPAETEPFAITTETDVFAVEAVLAWSTHRWGLDVHAFGNYRRLDEAERVERGIEEGLRAVLGDGPVGDAAAGLRAVVHVKLLDPQLPGPTRRRLVNPETIWLVADAIAAQLPAHLARHPELEADLRARIPTRANVDAGTFRDRWSVTDG